MTATAAIDSGKYTPELDRQRQLPEDRLRRAAGNDANQSFGTST